MAGLWAGTASADVVFHAVSISSYQHSSRMGYNDIGAYTRVYYYKNYAFNACPSGYVFIGNEDSSVSHLISHHFESTSNPNLVKQGALGYQSASSTPSNMIAKSICAKVCN